MQPTHDSLGLASLWHHCINIGSNFSMSETASLWKGGGRRGAKGKGIVTLPGDSATDLDPCGVDGAPDAVGRHGLMDPCGQERRIQELQRWAV
ncbi:hypothetical protein LTR28_004336 [Elasticomyces elasticus]|nr:hypothetical protein LTR28_004336 [Elasticomyces elasticus]